MMRVLISGGPGSGSTSTAMAVGKRLDLPVFDSDSYFHKPTDPPFQEQYSPEERRRLLSHALSTQASWILSGSVSTWGLTGLAPTHAVFLRIPTAERLERLKRRQRQQFGSRIDPGGDMEEEHESFMEWAAQYEIRTGRGRNLITDLTFLKSSGARLVGFSEIEPLEKMVARVIGFLSKPRWFPSTSIAGGANEAPINAG